MYSTQAGYLGVSGGPRGTHNPGIAFVDSAGNTRFVFEQEKFNRYKNSISCFPTQALDFALNHKYFCDQEVKYITGSGASYEDMHKRWPLYFHHNFDIKAQYRPFHHQLCHAASAFYSSRFKKSLIITLDGVGDKSSGLIAVGEDYKIKTIRFLNTDESIGFYWAYICQLIGYDGLEDAYKTMGLAPYGRAIYDMSDILKYKKGFFKLNTTYIRNKYDFISKHPAEPVYCEKLPTFMKNKKIRIRSQEIEQDHKDIACSAQNHLTNILIKFFEYYQEKTDLDNLHYIGETPELILLNDHISNLNRREYWLSDKVISKLKNLCYK